jgi:carbon starvation protein CstA
MNGEDLSVLLANEGLPGIVHKIATVFLGTIGGTVAVLGVIVLPITSGDTSFRAARMIIADYLKIDQKTLKNRFMIAIPLFVIAFILTKIDFQLLWRYFSWANQSISAIALWIGTVYLYKRKKLYIIALTPAFFITSVLGSFLFYDPTIGFGLGIVTSDIIGIVIAVLITILFFVVMRKNKELPVD